MLILSKNNCRFAFWLLQAGMPPLQPTMTSKATNTIEAAAPYFPARFVKPGLNNRPKAETDSLSSNPKNATVKVKSGRYKTPCSNVLRELEKPSNCHCERSHVIANEAKQSIFIVMPNLRVCVYFVHPNSGYRRDERHCLPRLPVQHFIS